ncbi:unnamed protein product [Vicia faba]|uniref:Uncharacterized protein n=1 Tax=Vicia faba TaxID=3906 RepID=A0AAV0ZHU1_VICFA|nr:unnamed protein product [Vicia faba]
MEKWPLFVSFNQLHVFLGLTGYYRRFIAHYASIVAPLANLLRHNSYFWFEEATIAFLALKQAIMAAPILSLSDFSKEFIIETDASNVGIGAVLMQDNHPLAFFSMKLGTLVSPYTIVNGLLLKDDRYVLNPQPPLCNLVISEFHDTPSGGHAGGKRTVAQLAVNFFWTGMCKAVENFVAACLICQQIKNSTQVPTGLPQPLPILEEVWEDITMDFITCLPPANGSTVIFVVVDRLSKSAHFSALLGSFTTSKWMGSPIDEASWEEVASFQACYRDFHLEDKVSVDEERNDTSPSITDPMHNEERPNNEDVDVSPIVEKRQSKKPDWMKDYVCK